jgi:tetratricopeptide (TPR) repeat protein
MREAIDDFSTALRLKYPKSYESYTSRGAAYAALGDYKRALADSDEAINIKPDYAAAYVNRGNARRQFGQLQPAAEDYYRAIELDPKLAEAHAGRGVLRLMQKEHRAAVDDLTRAIELNPKDAVAYRNRAVGWYELKRFDRAWADVEECRKLGVEPAAGFLQALEKASR